MNHRIGSIGFSLLVGLVVAFLSFKWIMNPEGREERVLQVAAVESSRLYITELVNADSLEIVDPVSPNRKVGKVYIYPEGSAWSVSGFYRRNKEDTWHPYLINIAEDHSLISLKLKDIYFVERAANDPLLELSP
ncbi:MAG: hypothetical protein P8J74_01325 [Woeseiaceae bacterium]|nr:hypothetical protein [Woeseiaceae bacterium]